MVIFTHNVSVNERKNVVFFLKNNAPLKPQNHRARRSFKDDLLLLPHITYDKIKSKEVKFIHLNPQDHSHCYILYK